MTPSVARWSGVAVVAALLASIGLLAVLSSGTVLVSQRGALGGTLVRAEFRNAAPLVSGMAVRISGVIAGTVESVELTDRGTARVGLRLAREIERPRADATAAIRQQDLIGDTYVALSPGSAVAPLRRTIPPSRTLALPRLDEVFSTFREPVRDGLHALLVELGTAMDARGADLNAAVLRLRPGFEAVDDLLGELDRQHADIGPVIADGERVTRGLAARSADASRTVHALHTTLGTLARRSATIDRTLAGAPAAMRQARSTLGRVSTLARRSQPLARTVARTAPDLRAIAPLIGPFADDAQRISGDVAPILAQLRLTLKASGPVVRGLAAVDPVDVLVPATDLLGVLSPVFADGAKALFGADSYGKDPEGDTGLGAVAVERGDQPSSPSTDPARTWLRTATVVTCQMFGAKIEPGCLARFLGPDAKRRARTPVVPARPPRPVLPRLPGARLPDATRPLAPLTDRLPKVAVPEIAQPTIDRATGALLDYLLG